MENVKKHVCPYILCDKSYEKLSLLESHLHFHEEQYPFKCDHNGCEKQYRRQDHLNRHVEQDHTPGAGEWSCPESDCEMTFKTEQNLKKHILRRHTKDRFKCRVPGCGQAFKKHGQLKVHSAEHSQDLPYRCQEPGCDKAFPIPSKLARHAKVHKGYLCDQEGCNVKCDTWTQLRKHKMLEHCSEFVCQVCNKKFRQKQWLKHHMQTHEEERTVFACTYEGCSREYLEQRNLNTHIRSYHEGKRFPCEINGCEQTFATKQKQVQHQKLHFSNKLPQKKKKKLHIEKALGISIATESRGQDSDISLKSPEQDRIILPDLSSDSSDEKEDYSVLPKKLGTFVARPIIKEESTDTKSDISTIECKKILSGYDTHRHLEPSCAQTAICVEDNIDKTADIAIKCEKRKLIDTDICSVDKETSEGVSTIEGANIKRQCKVNEDKNMVLGEENINIKIGSNINRTELGNENETEITIKAEVS